MVWEITKFRGSKWESEPLRADLRGGINQL